MTNHMIGYVRVSTEEQERSGLGVEAQTDDVPWSGGGFGRVVCVVDVGEPSCEGQ